MEELPKGEYPSKSIQSLPETVQSLLGIKTHLTPGWVESVCKIINALPSIKLDSDSMNRPSLKEAPEKDEMLAKIQGDISLLSAHLSKVNIERSSALNDYLDLKGNIRVFCRVRPMLGNEINCYKRHAVTSDASNVFLKISDRKSKQYSFDRVFHPQSTQDEVFSEIEPVIKSALDGYNICIFAYGQTGTGKTYTMEGRPECPGVVPRGLKALFEQAVESNYRLEFTFSMLEIYMGSLRDLLVPQSKKLRVHKTPCLSIQMDPSGGIEIENLVAVKVSKFEQVRKLYTLGSRFRSTSPTMSNSTSSRSHCLIRISITSSGASERWRETNKIWMVDLGGSERLLKTQASGKRLEEGKAINLSLSALGDVISALCYKKPHVPYRNSKLTQVLRDSLGLDSKTLMLVHVSPKEEDLCETVCSLGFATRVKSIHLGKEEQTEMRAKKELAMAKLLQKVKDLESECQDIRRDIERHNKRLKHLIGVESLSKGNLEASYPSSERTQRTGKDRVLNVKDFTGTLANLPRFMRPTICSRKKIGTDHKISSSKSTKPPIPPKKRKPSSVYAESVTSPAKEVVWKSEHGSDVCSISTLSNIETESSQETSVYDIKMVIFAEHEKSLRSLRGIISDENANELQNGQESKLDLENKFAIDNWLQLHTQWNKRALDIPTDADSKENLSDFKTEIRSCKAAENLDEAMDTVSSSLDMTNDSEKIDQRIKCNADDPEYTNNSNEIEGSTGTSHTERATPENKANSTSLKIHIEDLVESKKQMGDADEVCLDSVPSEKLSLLVEDLATFDHKCAAPGHSAVPIANSKERKRDYGTSRTNRKLWETIQLLWASALLGLGIHSIGFEHEFFQGLML